MSRWVVQSPCSVIPRPLSHSQRVHCVIVLLARGRSTMTRECTQDHPQAAEVVTCRTRHSRSVECLTVSKMCICFFFSWVSLYIALINDASREACCRICQSRMQSYWYHGQILTQQIQSHQNLTSVVTTRWIPRTWLVLGEVRLRWQLVFGENFHYWQYVCALEFI